MHGCIETTCSILHTYSVVILENYLLNNNYHYHIIFFFNYIILYLMAKVVVGLCYDFFSYTGTHVLVL